MVIPIVTGSPAKRGESYDGKYTGRANQNMDIASSSVKNISSTSTTI